MFLLACWALIIIGVMIWSRAKPDSFYGKFGIVMVLLTIVSGLVMGIGGEFDWDQSDTLTDIYWLRDSTVLIVSYFENIKMVEHITDAHMLDAVRIDSVKVIYEKAYNSYGGMVKGEFRIIFSADSMNITIERNGNAI